MKSNILECLALIFTLLWGKGEGHGRLLVPPARSTMWREGFDTPIEYTDNGHNCGGMFHQWGTHEGKCGMCGDPFDLPQPRPLENGGKFGTGTISRSYNKGDQIEIQVDITAPHMGWFLFRVCSLDDGKPTSTEECLNENPLTLTAGGTKYEPGNEPKIHKIMAQLPPDLMCNHCVLQWKYHAGNSWGSDDSGSGIGYGDQEEFYGCSDIQIIGTGVVSNITTPAPPPPSTTTTQAPVENFCFFTGDVGLLKFITVGEVSPLLDELCSCACEHESGLCESKLCSCTGEETCSVYSAIGNFARVNTSDQWCNDNCKNDPSFCPADKCTCAASTALAMIPSAPVVLMLCFSVFFLLSDWFCNIRN